MSTVFNTILAAMLILSMSATKADEPCSYCGTWKAWSAIGVSLRPKAALELTKTAIALPGCSPVPMKLIDESINSNVLSDQDFPRAVQLTTELLRQPRCLDHSIRARVGDVVKIQVVPRSQPNSEELVVDIRTPGKQLRTRYSWYLIRSDHNPCDEGGSRGAKMCDAIAEAAHKRQH